MKKKRYENVVEAEFRDDEPVRGRANGRHAKNEKRRGARGSWINLVLVALPLLLLKLMFSLASGIGLVVGEVARIVAVPLARGLTVMVAFTGMCLGVMYAGAYAIRGGVDRTRTIADSWHASLNKGADALLAMVPSHGSHAPDEDVPRAVPILANRHPNQALAPEVPAASEGASPVLDAISDAADGAVNLLLPALRDYPKPGNLPAIEGDILELAGGHRMQQLITSILPAVEQVESSGRQELIGDNGLAYGPLQVRHEPCEDLKERFGIEVNPADCNGNYALSEYVVRLYLGYWGIQHELRTGKVATAKDLCRTWNGGPDQGPYNKTDAYWARCKSHDDSIAYLAAD